MTNVQFLEQQEKILYISVDIRERMEYSINCSRKETERSYAMVKFNLKRLKAERVAQGMTQADIAKKLGMTRVSYAKRENGDINISVDEFAKILTALGYDKNKMPIFFEIDVPENERKE